MTVTVTVRDSGGAVPVTVTVLVSGAVQCCEEVHQEPVGAGL